MNMTIVLGCWLALGVVTISLAIYRKVLANHEDTSIHLAPGGGAIVEHQADLAVKLGAIDKWGKMLTIATFVIGLAIGAKYVYEALLAVPN
jgi:hypothetical protein